MSDLNQAEEVYKELNRLLSSQYNDTADEQQKAVAILMNVMMSGQASADLLIGKMKQMLKVGTRSAEYKSKLYHYIINNFWEKSYMEAIPRRKFIP